MANISLSINPTYRCNFRCKFCYLTPAQLGSRQLLDLALLTTRLEELATNNYTISSVDLYGGEVELLPATYYNDLIHIIRQRYDGNINVVTNLYMQAPHIIHHNMSLSVSYDFGCRDHSDVVYNNILTSPYDIHVLMLASECLIRQNVKDMISVLNAASNIKTVEIKPYSANQSNCQPVTYHQYEEFVQQWIESTDKRFALINEHRIIEVLTGRRNAFSDDHLYITPSGQFAVLDFDLNDREYFKPISHLGEYLDWAAREKSRVQTNKFCGSCKYLGTCLTEHYRGVTDIRQSCNGFKHLLEWYDERMENTPAGLSPITP